MSAAPSSSSTGGGGGGGNAAAAAGGGGGGGGGGAPPLAAAVVAREEGGGLKEVAMKAIVRQPAKALAAASVRRADAVLPNDKEGRQYVKQEVLDALIKENRLVRGTVPLEFYEKDQRRLSFKGASKITEAMLEVCQAVPALEYLDLSGCFLLGDAAIPLALQACPGLRSLKLENCRKMTDTALDHVIELGRAIQAVNVGGDFNMTEAGLLRLVTAHPNRHNFKELYLSGLPYSGQLLDAVATNCPKMRHLGIGYNDSIGEAALTDLLRRLRLRKLHVHWCQQAVTDSLLEVIGAECMELEELNICGCKQVSPQAVERLLQRCNGGEGGGGGNGPTPMDIDEPASACNSPVKRSGGGNSNSNNSGNNRKRIRKLKIRYATTSRQQVKAIEEAWADSGVEFPR